jgi:hypothetical protein
MKKITVSLMPIILLALLSNAQTTDNLNGAYLGQEPPGTESEVFAPDLISTEAGELNSVFCCDGNEFYFSRRGIKGKPSTLMVAKRINNAWTEPEPVKFSGKYNDIDLFITADGKLLIFCSRRPHKSGDYEKADHDFWISERNGESWTEPVPFASEAMSEYEDFFPVVTGSGNLYFNSQRGGQVGNNIYISRFQDGKYTEAEMLPEPVNSGSWEFDALVTQDEKMILFSSTRPGGYGGADIYLSYKEDDGSWSEPKNLGPEINSEASEYGASLTPDGRYFFYTSNRNGSEDIFWISADVLFQEEEPVIPEKTAKTPGEIFMAYLMSRWNDVHDVIMRYHYDDPGLKGVVSINMTWRQGMLSEADIQENTTGNEDYGLALVDVMKSWKITDLKDAWSSTLPIKTTIKGSDHPKFNEYGILTGKVSDKDGNPIPGVQLIMQPNKAVYGKADTLYTNREGIFIQTLIVPASYSIDCYKKGYKPVILKNIKFKKGQHRKQDIETISIEML